KDVGRPRGGAGAEAVAVAERVTGERVQGKASSVEQHRAEARASDDHGRSSRVGRAGSDEKGGCGSQTHKRESGESYAHTALSRCCGRRYACPMSKAETFLVTGALGCIGAWTCVELVREGVPVVAFDLGDDRRRLELIARPEEVARISFVRGDVTELGELGAVL